jgi:hypothetical protein
VTRLWDWFVGVCIWTAIVLVLVYAIAWAVHEIQHPSPTSGRRCSYIEDCTYYGQDEYGP